MKTLFILYMFVLSQVLGASELIFDMRPEKVIFEIYPLMRTDGDVSRVVEKTYLGKFYPETEVPLIDSTTDFETSEANPFVVLSNILKISESGDFDDLPALYAPEYRSQVVDALNDENLGPRMREGFMAIKSYSVLGYYFEAPRGIVAMVRMNHGQVLPMCFVLEDQWYLRAGSLKNTFHDDLSVYYAANDFSNKNIEIVSPLLPDDLLSLLSDEVLKGFAISNNFISVPNTIVE